MAREILSMAQYKLLNSLIKSKKHRIFLKIHREGGNMELYITLVSKVYYRVIFIIGFKLMVLEFSFVGLKFINFFLKSTNIIYHQWGVECIITIIIHCLTL